MTTNVAPLTLGNGESLNYPPLSRGKPAHQPGQSGSWSWAAAGPVGVTFVRTDPALIQLLTLVTRLSTEVAELQAKLAEVPRVLMLGTLDSAKYRLRLPVGVELSAAGDEFVAHVADFEVYATGEEEYSALAALREAIVEEYESLSSRREQLGPLLESRLRRLEEVLERVS